MKTRFIVTLGAKHMKSVSKCIVTLLIQTSVMLAGSQTIPGPSSGGANEAEVLIRKKNGFVNTLTGQPAYHVKLLSMTGKNGFEVGVDLHYGGNIHRQAQAPNWASEQGWCGTGWFLGFSHIYVEHNNTTNTVDDKWYFVYSNGSVSEILNTDCGIIVKNDRQWKIVPHYAETPQDAGDIPQIIAGWTVTHENGYRYIYGDMGGELNAGRYLTCNKDEIGSDIGAESVRMKFYYRWDLAEAVDPNGQKMVLEYDPTIATINGNAYVRESYPLKIISDIGDEFRFHLSPKGKYEISGLPDISGYDLRETQYLSRIEHKNSDEEVIQSYDLKYLLTRNKKDQHRYLVEASSNELSGRFKHVFEYNFNKAFGYLQKIELPRNGSSTEYRYSNRNVAEHFTDGSTKTHQMPLAVKVIRKGNGDNEPLTIDYDYPTDESKQLFDASSGMPYWKEIAIDEGKGLRRLTYDISSGSYAFGSLIAKDYLNSDGEKVGNELYSHRAIIDCEPWYPAIWRTVRTIDHVNFAELGCDWVAGQFTRKMYLSRYPNPTRVPVRIEQKRFAYQDYPEMEDLNMINYYTEQKVSRGMAEDSHDGSYADVCGIVTSDWGIGVEALNARIVSRTTWKEWDGKWLPEAWYVWKSEMDDEGVPVDDFTEFQLEQPTANGWLLTKRIDGYNFYGKPLQVSLPGQTPSSVVYRNDYGLPIADIKGASHAQCGVYTCDYKAGDDTKFWDKHNGWERGNTETTTIMNGKGHFGNRFLRVENDTAAVRNTLILPGEGYRMTAWVKVIRGELFMAAAFGYPEVGHESDWPQEHLTIDNEYGRIKTSVTAGDCGGKWKLLELIVPISETNNLAGGREWYARTWIGNQFDFGSSEGVEAYIDDIRFYPEDALVKTNFYHEKWRKMIAQVDENNNPGRRVEYDYAGRVSKIWKINKAKDSQDENWGKLIRETEYHLQPDVYQGPDINLVWPNSHVKLTVGETYGIEWMKDPGITSNVFVYLTTDGGVNWDKIGGLLNTDHSNRGKGVFFWKCVVPESGRRSDKCKIKVVLDSEQQLEDVSYLDFEIGGDFTAPSLEWPQNSSTNVQSICGELILNWKGVSRAEQPVKYTIHFGKNTSPAEYATIDRVTQYNMSTQVGNLEENTVYYWKVTAVVGSDVYYSSPTWVFRTGESVPLEGMSGCGGSPWIFAPTPQENAQFRMDEEILIRWLAKNTSQVGIDYWSGSEWVDAVGWYIQPNDWQWGCLEWKAPPELAGRTSKIRVRHYDFPNQGRAYETETFTIKRP